ncbi:hypothetical protein J2741_000758 [Methanolinea mesophila]|uniref:COG1361 S-layer family protein n=1 Tax=Methanolinea mesophila TaxID=547055 RepID=UPI001AE1EF18|nr:COG1361 S-layer family protein [Methanolinea mesophila]MBP1928211.1 hypothetical protein [Methanolinea mesophila]
MRPSIFRSVLILAAALLLLAGPGMAGTTYLSGSPDLSLSLSGDTLFSPAEDVTLNVVIKNQGLNEVKLTGTSSSAEDLPNQARMVTVDLQAGDAPVTVKSDSQMIGDIPGGSTATVPFSVKINPDAVAGRYTLPVQVGYTYLYFVEQIGNDDAIYHYRTVNETLDLPLTIKAEVNPEVIEVLPEDLYAGGEGYVTLKIRNAGYLDGQATVAKISRSGSSPVVPMTSSVYIGDFPPGAVAECRYKVKVLEGAGAQSYPIDVVVTYQDENKDTVSSDAVSAGVPVKGKIEFTVVSPPATMKPGDSGTLEVVYENTGAGMVYSAQARLSATDPFSSATDTAVLGDLAPGERATARFQVSVDKSATIKDFGLDSEVRYRDSLGNSLISDPLKVRVTVEPREGIDRVLANPILLSIIGAVIVVAGYYVYTRKRKP